MRLKQQNLIQQIMCLKELIDTDTHIIKHEKQNVTLTYTVNDSKKPKIW